jgi:adenosine deaminase
MVKEVFEEVKMPRVHYTVPKAEMHVHISLALSDEGFKRRVKRRRTPLELDFIVNREKRYYQNLTEFHGTYEDCRDMTKTPQELADTVQQYLQRIAREGAIYAEISNSFREGALFESQMEAVSAGIEAARHNTGIESRIVVTSLRNSGAEKAEEAVKSLAKIKEKYPLITGFGLVGDEGVNRFSDFKKPLHMAWDAGFGLTPHVAEQQLHNAVDFLDSVPKETWNINPNDHRRLRVGHGVLIHMSSDLMREFAERQICMELCISANKRIGLPQETKKLKSGNIIKAKTSDRSITIDRDLRPYYEQAEEHPIKTLMDAGIPVCLGSDNPLLMNTNIGKEYSMSHKAGVTETSDHLQITRNAIMNANVDAVTRGRLLSHVDNYSLNSRPSTTALGYKRVELTP